MRPVSHERGREIIAGVRAAVMALPDPPPVQYDRFNRPLPTVEQLLADGGRLLVVHALRDMDYKDYLLTNHWQNVREQTFKLHGHRCYVCGLAWKVDVHHVTYDNLGFEKPEDTVPLCRAHHKLQHKILRTVIRMKNSPNELA